VRKEPTLRQIVTITRRTGSYQVSACTFVVHVFDWRFAAVRYASTTRASLLFDSQFPIPD